MKNLLKYTALLVMLAAPAAWGQAPPPRPAPVASPLLINAAQYNAKGDGVADDGPALQKAIDAAAAASKAAPGGSSVAEVYVPPGWYNLNSGPLYLDSDNVRLRSDGAHLVQMGLCPAIAVGIPRNDIGRVVDSSYRPGGASLSTAGSSGPAYMKFAGGPLDLGQNINGAWDHYGKTSQLTVDLSMILPRDTGQFICGLGAAGGQESPWAVFVGGDNPDMLMFSYRTSGQPANASPFSVWVNLAGIDRSKAFSVSFQVDLSAGKTWAFLNKARVQTVDNGDRRKPGPTFLCNEGVNPFMIGESTPKNMTIFGLSAATSLKYRDVPVGAPQLRADNGQPADQAYIVNPYNLTGLLDSVWPGVLVGDPRFIRTQKAFGFFCHTNSQRFSKGNRISGFHIRHNSTGILHGQTLETSYSDLSIDGGVRGLASFSQGCSYTVYGDRLELAGNDTPLFLRWMLFLGNRINFSTSGVDSMRVADSSVTVEHAMVAFPGADQKRVVTNLGGQYGGGCRLVDWTIDFEGNTLADCGMLFHQTAYTPGSVILDGITFGSVGKVPLIRLHTWDNTEFNVGWRCTADISNITCFDTQYTALIEADGTAWHGRAFAPYLSKGLKVTTPSGPAPAVVPDLDVKVGK